METIFLSTPIDLSGVDADLVVSQGPEITVWDYNLTVELKRTELFSTSTYKQNTVNNELYDVVLTVDTTTTNTQLNNVGIVANDGRRFLGFKSGTSESAGGRLVEILATKIFGHAKARAAIENDDDIVARQSSLVSGLANSFSTDRNMIFQQYVNLDRVQNDANVTNNYNDVDTTRTFNFEDITFKVPVYLRGSVLTDASAAARNGPTDVGGNIVVNGSYNVPLILQLSINASF